MGVNCYLRFMSRSGIIIIKLAAVTKTGRESSACPDHSRHLAINGTNRIAPRTFGSSGIIGPTSILASLSLWDAAEFV
jgi:hypothetical protein